MEFSKIVALRGPNRWCQKPVLEAWVDLGALPDVTSKQLDVLRRLLAERIPGITLGAADGEPVGQTFLSASVRQTGMSAPQLTQSPSHTLAALLQAAASELVVLSGPGERFGQTRPTASPAQFALAISCPEEGVARECLLAARELCLAGLRGEAIDFDARLKQLRELYDTVCLGPSTRAIVAAAAARDIPSFRLNRRSLVQLGLGARQRRIMTAETNRTGAIAESISQDKELTKRLLKAVGVPVPEGRVVDGPEDAWDAAQDITVPVVVKPRDGNHGRGVFTNLNAQEEIMIAYEHAAKEGDGVIVERYIPGAEHRVLVVGDRVVAATRGEAAFIVGDGRQTVEQLVEEQLNSDPRRGDDYASPLSKIEYDPTTIAVLERQGLTVQSVPAAGRSVLIQVNGNLSNDVTDQVHPDVAARAVEAARAVGLDIAGIDIVISDISRPMEEQRAAVVEVNAGPGLQMHLQPSTGKPRPVGEAIVATLFPAGEAGRIPLVCVTGDLSSEVTQMVAHLLEADHRCVGLSLPAGIWIAGRRIDTAGLSRGGAMRNILINPGVEAAVLEMSPEMVRDEGLCVDDCDVAILVGSDGASSNGSQATPDPLGDESLTERLLIGAVRRSGFAVVPAAAAAGEWLKQCPGSVVLYGIDAVADSLAQHRAQGGRAVYVDNKRIVASEGHRQKTIVSLGRLAAQSQGRPAYDLDRMLAAVAAAWALGVEAEQIGDQLAALLSGNRLAAPVVVLGNGESDAVKQYTRAAQR